MFEARVRTSVQLDSAIVATLHEGDSVTAVERCKDLKGNVRVKISDPVQGWMTMTGHNLKDVLCPVEIEKGSN